MSTIEHLLTAYLNGDRTLRGVLISNPDLMQAIQRRLSQASDKDLWQMLHLVKDMNDADHFALIKNYLSHSNSAIQSLVAQIAGQYICDEAVMTLIEHLQPPYTGKQISVAHSLGRIGDQRAAQPLYDLVASLAESDQYEVLLYTAIEAIGKIGVLDKPDTLPLLEQFKTHPSHHVRERAAKAINRLTADQS